MAFGLLLSILVILVAVFSVAFVVFKLISRWYRQRFGTVEPTRHQRLMGALLGGSGALAFLLPMNLEQSMWYSAGQTLPLNVALFTMALWIIGFWLYLGRSFRHYLVLAGIGLVLGLASAAGVPPATWPWHLREAALYIAAAAITSGLLDHRILTRSLSQPGDRLGKEA